MTRRRDEARRALAEHQYEYRRQLVAEEKARTALWIAIGAAGSVAAFGIIWIQLVVR
ncbi:hypothetical protein [Microbacterium sp. F2]|uniref:hypothetical protein n=1 Tax=Microbacterium sp. F2 TaxID=3422228 RepID=UPI003FD5AAD1